MLRARRHTAVILVAFAVEGTVLAQGYGGSYSQIYGEPVDVSVKDLAFGVVPLIGRAVRTRGYVELDLNPNSQRQYLLQDEGFHILIVPRPEIASAFDFDGASLLGKRVEIVGLFETNTGAQLSMAEPTGRIEFWSWTVVEVDRKKLDRARTITLETLVTRPDRFVGQDVRFVGEFRGCNLYGDLPRRSLRLPSDWVVRDESHAVWITGRKPEGKGWSLSTRRKRDTGKWLVIVGRTNVEDGIVYVRASSVALTAKPSRRASPNAAAIPVDRPRMPPVIVFSLPLDGDTNVAPATRIAVQFSKDMDPRSFFGRILMRYAGPRRLGDVPFDYIQLEYDDGHRALRIDPGDALKSGREVELLLLPGIRDRDGLDLAPRAGHRFDDAVDIIRYVVGS
jgi:hypothetical protein